MIASALQFAFAFAIIFLMTEVHSTPQLVVGWIMTIWFVVVGAVSGWMAANK